MMEGNTDKELTKRLQNDDLNAFNELYRRYHSAIYYNILKLARDLFIAEDIVQEVFIALWEKRHSLDNGQEISGWLFVVSYNKSISHLKQKLKESLAQAELQQNSHYNLDERNDLVDIQMHILENAIAELSPQKRRVFELCKMQRKTYEEAGEELKISKHTVKEYLSGALNSIREYIKQHSEYSVILLGAFLFQSFFF